jgi:hypothetical protein
MGKMKDLAMEEQYQFLGMDEEEEFHYYHTISAFKGLLDSYGYDMAVANMSEEHRYGLCEAIINANFNMRPTNASTG